MTYTVNDTIRKQITSYHLIRSV